MFETIFEMVTVIVVVTVVLGLTARSFYRNLEVKKKGSCCGCGLCSYRDGWRN